MAKKDSTLAPTINPLIDESSPLDTLDNVKGVIWFLDFTLPQLMSDGSSKDANRGLAMILECAAQALDHVRQVVQPKAVHHG